MKKSRMSRILIEGDPGLLQRLCKQIESAYPVSVVKPPEKSLVMTKAKDSVSQQPFYVGEILVTECTVTIAGNPGIGVIMGEQGERAYQLAVVDAACNAALPETSSWMNALIAEECSIAERHRLEYARAMKSKVNFDTMGEYHANR